MQCPAFFKLTLGFILSLMAVIGSRAHAFEISENPAAHRVFYLQGELDGVLLGKHLDLYFDENNALGFDEIQSLRTRDLFTPSKADTPGHGIKVSTIWASLKITNPSDRPRTVYIENRHPTDHLSLYRVLMDGTVTVTTLGLREDSEHPEVSFHFPVFKVTLAPGENELFFQLKSLNPTFILFLWDEDHFQTHRLTEFAWNGFLFGAMILMMFYNIFIFATGRNIENLLYVSYLFGFMVVEGYLTGFGTYYLGSYRFLLMNFFPTGLALGALSAIEFSKSFLHFSDFKRSWAFLRAVKVCFVIIAILNFYSIVWAEYLLVPAMFSSFSLILFAGIKRSSEGYRPAIFFTTGWIFMTLCGMIIVLSRFSLIPLTDWTIKIGNFGLLIEMSLLSLAIGEKIKGEREAYIRNLSSQNDKIQHAFGQMKKVFFPHQVAMIEEGRDLETTMPTGRAEACVLCFDVVGSSKIQHEKTKEFLREVFRRCNAIMSENYHGEDMASNAFRIKEMGDGFLCSIGYPFKSRTGHMAMDALDLAHRFAEAFHEEARALDYRDPLHCSIGIAMGTLSGFFPSVGTKQYDLYGRAITLATRYEGMRKVVLQQDQQQSIIILQERVYLSLAQTERAKFKELDLVASKIVVRDDPGAARLYFRKMDKAS